MGQKLSQVVNESTDKQKEGLKFLCKMIVSKLKSFEHELLNPPSNSHMVRIGTVVDKVEDIHINASTNSDKLSDEINKTLDSLFSGDTATALKMALSTTVKTFLGRSEAGELTFRDYHIYLQENALVRLDVMLYKYNFTSENVLHSVNTVNAYLFYKSIINHEEVSRDLMIYEITRFVRNYMKGTALTRNSKLNEQKINEEVTQCLQRLHSIYKLFDHDNNIKIEAKC
ncbi:1629_t:CDS:2 [Paraglomus brasilianum]|uniref:1629_t:CDS:1 n=1 Tax=Paraglomus brasilianum TaxID=144538 RepID=A0A9N9AVD8_9GLOM|nr:1629_t:CDS:2 [Paraglomus brasilianum]